MASRGDRGSSCVVLDGAASIGPGSLNECHPSFWGKKKRGSKDRKANYVHFQQVVRADKVGWFCREIAVQATTWLG